MGVCYLSTAHRALLGRLRGVNGTGRHWTPDLTVRTMDANGFSHGKMFQDVQIGTGCRTSTARPLLARYPRFHMHFTPPARPGTTKSNAGSGPVRPEDQSRRPQSFQALEKDIRAWFADWNDNQSPFIWTQSAEVILESLARFYSRISGADVSLTVVSHGRCRWRRRRSRGRILVSISQVGHGHQRPTSTIDFTMASTALGPAILCSAGAVLLRTER